MAAWLRASCLFLLLSLSLADNDLPCEGFQVMEGYGMADVEAPLRLGVKILQVPESVESDEACWGRCCQTEGCDLALTSGGKCHLIDCSVLKYDMCVLSAQDGARAYLRVNAGAKPKQEDFCLPKNDSGPCRASFSRWWYDATSGTCKSFIYGGCVVNLNNHADEEECMKTCSGVTAKDADAPAPPERQVADRSLTELCSGPAVVGRCRAAFPRWFYNSDTQACEKFTYGGCDGSKNNHMSEEVCQDSCVAKKSEPEPVQAPKAGSFKEYCAAPPVIGNCRASFKRFYYDPEAGVCKPFTYGGCKGNKNNYMKEEDCVRTCSGRSEEDDYTSDHHALHRPLTAVILPILLAILAASLLGVMIVFFVKVARKNQRDSDFQALWNPIDDKECLMNNAYSL